MRDKRGLEGIARNAYQVFTNIQLFPINDNCSCPKQTVQKHDDVLRHSDICMYIIFMSAGVVMPRSQQG